jgi:hypothetical protein
MVQAHHPFESLCPTWLCDTSWTFISSMPPPNARLSAALGPQLLGLLGAEAGGSPQSVSPADIPAWVSPALRDCSALLLSVNGSSDLAAAIRDEELRRVGHVNSLLRPAVKNFVRRTAPNQPSLPSGSITEVSELAPQLRTAHIHASWAALERDPLLYSLFQVALEHYDRAWKLFEEKVAGRGSRAESRAGSQTARQHAAQHWRVS